MKGAVAIKISAAASFSAFGMGAIPGERHIFSVQGIHWHIADKNRMGVGFYGEEIKVEP